MTTATILKLLRTHLTRLFEDEAHYTCRIAICHIVDPSNLFGNLSDPIILARTLFNAEPSDRIVWLSMFLHNFVASCTHRVRYQPFYIKNQILFRCVLASL